MPQTPLYAFIQGQVYYAERTKELISRLPIHAIAIIQHEDIDELAADDLINCQVQAVVNLSASMSGNYPSYGTQKLIQAGVPVYDLIVSSNEKQLIKASETGIIVQNKLWVQQRNVTHFISMLIPYSPLHITYKLQLASQNKQAHLHEFVSNSLRHAVREVDEMIRPVKLPKLHISLQDRHALIVSRGKDHVQDLQALSAYIQEAQPVLIGVDGGADAIVDCGYEPDLIIGDMDSVHTHSIQRAKDLVVHAYQNGYAPGMAYITECGLSAQTFACKGTSEDAALILAYEAGAAIIVTVGSHTGMIDFMEKGRKGMGSTILARLKVADKLIDAKGFQKLLSLNQLYNERKRGLTYEPHEHHYPRLPGGEQNWTHAGFFNQAYQSAEDTDRRGRRWQH